MSGSIEFWSNICMKMFSNHEFSGIWKTNFNDKNFYQYNVFILNGKWCALLRLIPVKKTILVYWTGIHLLQTKFQFRRTLIDSDRTNKNPRWKYLSLIWTAKKPFTNHKPLFLCAFFPFLLFQLLVSFLPLLYVSLPLSSKNDTKLVSSSICRKQNLLQIFDVIPIEISKHAYHSYLLLGPKLVSFCHIRIFMYIRFFIHRSLLKRHSYQVY